MFQVVDLFAGPGGLAEGFASVRDAKGRPVFEIGLSVEKDVTAHRTLTLRSFFRQFPNGAPHEYYQYLSGLLARQELETAFKDEWTKAYDEARCLELGSEKAETILNPIIDRIRAEAGDRVVLIGGPPCQAYSLVGRARNKGIANYVASEDSRHFLYKEYIRILERLSPAAFIMENVKGFLSAKVDGHPIFRKVIADLQATGLGYKIVPLVMNGGVDGREFLIRAEDHGIPQRRHRVILFGLRQDLTNQLEESGLSIDPLQSVSPVSVQDIIGAMPRLRSGLSGGKDSSVLWRLAVEQACQLAAQACRDSEGALLPAVADQLDRIAFDHRRASPLPRASGAIGTIQSTEVSDWLIDSRLKSVANHETRGHMEGDLSRYIFAATFAAVHGSSPRARDFPAGLAPDHKNWKSDKFNDRFKVQLTTAPASTVTSHISKDGNYFIHPDPLQCRSLTVREAARIQTFPDNYFFEGGRTQQYTQVGNAVPPLLANKIAKIVAAALKLAMPEGN